MTLRERFESGPNALNAIRLLLALEVIGLHSWTLSGRSGLPSPLLRLANDIGVDGFFVISGFLITRSWVRRPDPMRFLAARARRLLPGLWVSVTVTAFVLVPAVTALADRPPRPSALISWWADNIGMWPDQWGIDGTLSGQHSTAWNGALWSLGFEAACYLILCALGVLGLIRRRFVLAIAVAFWLPLAAAAQTDIPTSTIWVLVPRCGFTFAAGAALWLWSDRVPASSRLAIIASASVIASPLLFLLPRWDDYRLLAAPGLGYLAVYGSVIAASRWPRLVWRTDLSYGTYVYAFPIQQSILLLLDNNIGWLAFAGLSVVLVLPVAACSWFLVERRFLRLGGGLPVRRALAHMEPHGASTG